MSISSLSLPLAGRRPWLRGVYHYLPLALVVALWELVAISGLVDRSFLPSAGDTLAALWELVRDREIALNLWTSTYRAFTGLFIGSVLGIVIGMTMAISPRANGFFGPLVTATYSLPKSSLVPLFLLWFGIGDTTDILTVVLACLLPVIVSTHHGLRSISPVVIWSAQAMGTPRRKIAWRILLPAASLSIFTGIRIALGFCFVLTISSEMIAAKVGIGTLIFFYGESGAYAHMFAGLLTVLVVAYFADRSLLAIMHYALRWHESVHAEHDNA